MSLITHSNYRHLQFFVPSNFLSINLFILFDDDVGGGCDHVDDIYDDDDENNNSDYNNNDDDDENDGDNIFNSHKEGQKGSVSKCLRAKKKASLKEKLI